ncbi:hypothetical protein [Streptomyces sp. SHP 1-2]|uniref:hypothetical protein n=1 Tax=Streptomyces sp. SHP 1-2 TaxID=2769489 RepID=UPI002237C7C8|nr:hypothetical protein [Streptomyces sp. SHP 1-2]MCW5250151.1 hypothetical protein [Streptomyces sp. SHP 1-2]
MTGSGGVERGARDARARALAVLRVRSWALAVALLPAAAAVILLVGGSTGRLAGGGWDAARWAVCAVALLVLLAAAGVALVVACARPAVTPTVEVSEEAAPDLYRMVRDLAERLAVPAPSAIALTPDCDSWLEDRTHRSHRPRGRSPVRVEEDDVAGLGGPVRRRAATAPVLVIGSPFLWWMRVGELRAVLAPVVAGTGPSAHPDIAAARRFIRGLDAAAAVAGAQERHPLLRVLCAGLGRAVRLMLRACRDHAAEMERGVAAAAAERAQAVDYGLRIVAQEQVGLAYAGWDRLLTRVALPAWRMGRWPSRLDVGVVAALTELSRRDRLAEGFASRLAERPACDLLEEPGVADEAVSLLAARLFHGGPAACRPDWSPVEWSAYPDEVVDRTWRADAARLHRALDTLGVRRPTPAVGPTLARVLDHLAAPTPPAPDDPGPGAGDPGTGTEPYGPSRTEDPPGTESPSGTAGEPASDGPSRTAGEPASDGPRAEPGSTRASGDTPEHGPSAGRGPGPESGPGAGGEDGAARPPAPGAGHGTDPVAASAATPGSADHGPRAALPPVTASGAGEGGYGDDDDDDLAGTTPRSAALAAGLAAQLAREDLGTARGSDAGAGGSDAGFWDDRPLPLVPLQPPRTGREILTDHVTAMVCCAAMDTAGARPGLDWLDGPSLLVDGVRVADLAPRVHALVESGDCAPLRAWLTEQGIRPDKPVRLV